MPSERADFAGWKAADHRKHESMFMVAMLGYFVIVLLARSILILNWVPAITSGTIVAMHLGSRMLYCGSQRPRWLVCSVLLVDCFLMTCANTCVQNVIWGSTDGLLANEGCTGSYANQLSSLQTSFIFVITLSYLSTFLLLYREAVAVVMCGVVMYISILFASRLHEGVGLVLSSAMTVPFIHEGVLSVSVCLLSLAVHRSLERSERKNFEALNEQRDMFFQEKILRCQAEFTMEAMKDATQRGGDNAQLSSAPRSEAGHSLPSKAWSAPAGLSGALRSFLREAVAWSADSEPCTGRADGMDCLPRDATVWVEGEQAPKPLWQLGRGERVLCHDVLANSARYVDVDRVEEDSQAVEWVDVELADGTRLAMTADHPVQIVGQKGAHQGSGRNFGGSVVRAGRLEAEQHQIVVYRTETQPVKVRTVTAMALGSEQPPGRVSVTVKQSARHSILVAAPGGEERTPTEMRLMAVGSADLAVSQVDIQNTFLHAADPPSPTNSVRSWPPSRQKRPASGSAALAPRRSSAAGAEPSSNSSKGRSSSSGPTLSSRSETLSECSVQLPPSSGQGVRISHLLQLRAEGLPSMGSRGHSQGACQPCRFDHHGRCSHGVWCHHCHGQHSKIRGRLRPIGVGTGNTSPTARGG